MQTADPAVSRLKFEREVGYLREIEQTLVSRGIWIMSAEFPVVKVAFATVNLRPRFVPFAVKVDFTDYDALPLAITFVDPFDDHELLPSEMMTRLPRVMQPGPAVPTEGGGGMVLIQQVVELYQSYPQHPGAPGFLCLPGTRAYHAHPAHSGDPWELHRAGGEGKLFALLDIVWRYGVASVDHIQVTALNFGLGHSQVAA